jgi:hypothetical protein
VTSRGGDLRDAARHGTEDVRVIARRPRYEHLTNWGSGAPFHSAAAGLRADQRREAVVVLVARGAALEVRPHTLDRRVGVLAGAPELDVAVEVLEALLAGQLRALWAEQPAQQFGGSRHAAFAHAVRPSRSESSASPSTASRALSFLRASWRVL